MQMPVALPRRLTRLPAPSRWLWLVAVALLAVVGVIGYLRWTTPVARAGQGQQVPVRRGTIAQTVSTSGTTVSTRQVKLNFAAGGKIKEVYVKLGDRVTVGQPIAALDPAPFELKIENAQSAVRQAEIKVQQLREGVDARGDHGRPGRVRGGPDEVPGGRERPDRRRDPGGADLAGRALSSQVAAQAKLDQLLGGPKADEVAAAQQLARIGQGLARVGRGEAGRPQGRPEEG